MSNPTSNFGWQMPTATDLVTDLPADFEVFGQAVDTDFVDLLGGTTGQILSKTSATDLDFTWIANDQGDITGVTAGNGITVTSPTGPVPTVAIDTSVTVDKTTAQTLTNKTLTSPALTTPTISTLTTNGDLVYGTGSGALSRLGIGTTGQSLVVAAGVPSWATASSGALTLISTTNFTSQSSQAFNSVFSGTYRNYKVIMSVLGSSDPYTLNFYYRASGTNNTSANYNWGQSNSTRGGTLAIGSYGSDVANMPLGPSTAPTGSTVYFNVDATVFQPFGLGKRQTIHLSYTNSTNGGQGWSAIQGYESTAYDGFAITPSAGTITGTVSIYGMSN